METMETRHIEAERERLLDAREWFRAFLLYPRPDRMREFFFLPGQLHDKHQAPLSEKEYWTLLRDVWMDAEDTWSYRNIFPVLFETPPVGIKKRYLVMSKYERHILASLPDTVTIYRGCDPKRKRGWSWTLSENKARWFAKRLNGVFANNNVLVVGQCARSSVIAYFAGRREREIVINPVNVTILRTIPIQ